MLIIKRDYDEDETIKDKVRKISEVRDLRGLGVLLNEMILTSRSKPGKASQDQFLGLLNRLNVPLRTIPLTGIERWYPL